MSDKEGQPERALPDASSAPTERSGPQRPKRLPGLWIICVLFGLWGMGALSAVFLATPFGMVVFSCVALAFFAAAIGLWLRSNVIRIGAMPLLALAFAWVAAKAIPDFGAEALIPSAIGLCPVAAALLYLHLRRTYFKLPATTKPRLTSVNGVLTMTAVGCLGVAAVLLLAVDDPAQSFPGLTSGESPVAEEDNALSVLSDMMMRFPIREDTDIGRLLYPQDPDKLMSAEQWTAEASEVLRRWKECLAEADEMLGRKTLALEASDAASLEPAGETEWLAYCRQLARLLALESKLHCYEGRLAESLHAAGKIAALGSLLCGQNVGLLSYLTGIALLSMGEEKLREAAANKLMSGDLLLAEMPRLEREGLLKQGAARAMAWECRRQRLFWQGCKEEGGPYGMRPEGSQGDRARGRRLLRDHMPLVKTNMSLNMAGTLSDEILDGLDHYVPLREETPSHPSGSWARRYGWLHHVRNPIGDILVALAEPAWGRLPVAHFRSLATARLTQVFLAVRCYQLESGRIPKALDELAPKYFAEVPTDPFTDQAFSYEPDATPPRLYSVGPDQKPDAPDAKEKDDIVVELNFPPPANRNDIHH